MRYRVERCYYPFVLVDALVVKGREVGRRARWWPLGSTHRATAQCWDGAWPSAMALNTRQN